MSYKCVKGHEKQLRFFVKDTKDSPCESNDYSYPWARDWETTWKNNPQIIFTQGQWLNTTLFGHDDFKEFSTEELDLISSFMANIGIEKKPLKFSKSYFKV